MRQTCLCKHLGIVCKGPHVCSFLRLPASVRRRIYEYAGVGLDIEGESRKEGMISLNEDELSLLYVCRTTRADVEAIIFSQQHPHQSLCVVVGADDTGEVQEGDVTIEQALYYLLNLPNWVCLKLRVLYVQLYLNPWWCLSRNKIPRQIEPSLITLWQRAIRHVLARVEPGTLTLHLVCDIPSEDHCIEPAREVLLPLSDFPGVLEELQMLLHNAGRVPCLKALAGRIALIAQRPREPDPYRDNQPFRFLDLPVEIRQLVFSYTNLVSPCRRIQWSPDVGFSAPVPFCACEDGIICREEHIHHALKFHKCDAQFTWTDARRVMPFCQQYSSGYSSRCNHKQSPLALFLVSRAVYEEAIRFFYANNRVVIVPSDQPQYTVFATSEASLGQQEERETVEFRHLTYIREDATGLFLNRINQSSISLLRQLEIVFPRIPPESSPGGPAFGTWLLAVERLHQADIPRLTLILHIWTFPHRNELSFNEPGAWPDGHCIAFLAQQSTRLVQPLRDLTEPHVNRNLRLFFVHLQCYRHWSPSQLRDHIRNSHLPEVPSPNWGIGSHCIPPSTERIRKLESQIEKIVMGVAYNSYECSKEAERPSPWLRQIWDSDC
ncbi:hypothetical protein F5Y16DRAFT_85175 [Xylariaceae sp. FL0255]|nr:hypothetical protein F5Y16DRAFT_85175 [Xylariaceae sp. FL0255]